MSSIAGGLWRAVFLDQFANYLLPGQSDGEAQRGYGSQARNSRPLIPVITYHIQSVQSIEGTMKYAEYYKVYILPGEGS